MTRLLVTGADGFVGRHLVRAARRAGRSVVASVLPGADPPTEWADPAGGSVVDVTFADLTSDGDVRRLAQIDADQVVHLAAMASGAAARRDPEGAMRVNSAGLAGFIGALRDTGRPLRFLFVSTAEVYGAGHTGPIAETATPHPVSPYGASKLAAEHALAAEAGAGSIRVIIARAFPHTGPGQSTEYVLPALAARLLDARRNGHREVPVGNLEAIRDFLDVRDVVGAYLALLSREVPVGVYNVASGVGRRLSDCFTELAALIGVEAQPTQDASLMRPSDIPALIGDATLLTHTTGWSPRIPFERTLQDLIDAQAY
ncbi:MAG: NAD-dependent epimerase/dehydratase family protein [Gemmatimonadota bacterium]